MITEAAAIRKLALRSDLPRLKQEGFHLFAQLEPQEQKLAELPKFQLLSRAFAALIAEEERASERPLPAVLPRAYQSTVLSPDWLELEFACDLAEAFERRNRAGEVLAVAKHLKGRVRLFKGAFAYFTPEDVRLLETVETQGFVRLDPG